MKSKSKSMLRRACTVLNVVSASAALLSSPLAFSGGYEKPDTFSGKWGALGGAAASSVSGGEALFFNPAGLAGGDSTFEATGDLSPTILKFSGPLAGNASVNSDTNTIPAFGVFAAYKINPKWGIAIGTYLSGGAKAIYTGASLANAPVPAPVNGVDPVYANSTATIQSNLSVIEFSVGTGYEILDGLRLGIDYRMAMVHAALGSYGFDPTSGSLNTVTIDGISGTAWNGFRLGLQYYPKESRWGIGAQWRSQVNFTGQGNVSGSLTPSGTAAGTALGDSTLAAIPYDSGNTATVSNSFPQQFDVGAHYDIIPNGLRMHLQYTFTNYSVDQTLAIAGNGSILNGAKTFSLTNIDQQWHNENDLRVGFDCFEMQGWIFRASYVFSSAVTPADRARATFTPPGSGHTFALGAGTMWLNNALETDLALEYGFSNADTTNSGAIPLPDGTAGTLGSYSASDFAAHLGVTYRM